MRFFGNHSWTESIERARSMLRLSPWAIIALVVPVVLLIGGCHPKCHGSNDVSQRQESRRNGVLAES